MPSTWKQYGVDANHDGKKDPFNPVDAIFAAARYLKAAGADTDIRKAVFAYNHADWYVDSVLMRARLIGGLPSDLVGSLTGLTQGRFPVGAKATYADDLSERDDQQEDRHRATTPRCRSRPTRAAAGSTSTPSRARPAIATQDGKIVKIGNDQAPRPLHPAAQTSTATPTPTRTSRRSPTAYAGAQGARRSPRRRSPRSWSCPRRTPSRPQAATAGTQTEGARPRSRQEGRRRRGRRRAQRSRPPPPPRRSSPRHATEVAKERAFANPSRPGVLRARRRGAAPQPRVPGRRHELPGAVHQGLRPGPQGRRAQELKVGSKVIAGTILGRLGARRRSTSRRTSLFAIRPAGKGAPRIDPKPILDGWKLLESTAIYRAAGKNPFFGPDAKNPSIGQILLMSKEALQQPRPRRPADRDLRLRPPRHRGRAASTAASWRRSSSSPTSASSRRSASLECGHGLPDDLGQRLRALLGQRGRHRRDQRDPDPRPPGRRARSPT